MPAKNPRLSVTLTPEAAAVIARIAHLRHVSSSSVVGEIVELITPIFERVAQALEAAAALAGEADSATRDIVAGLDRAQSRLEAQLGLALGDMEAGYLPLLQQAEKVHRRSARARRRAGDAAGAPTAAAPARTGSTPVPVTRGSGHPKRGPGAGKTGQRVKGGKAGRKGGSGGGV